MFWLKVWQIGMLYNNNYSIACVCDIWMVLV